MKKLLLFLTLILYAASSVSASLAGVDYYFNSALLPTTGIKCGMNDCLTMDFAKGGGANDPKANANYFVMYGGNTLTITGENVVISSVVINCNGAKNPVISVYDGYSGSITQDKTSNPTVITWTSDATVGPLSKIVLKDGNNSQTAQAQITSIRIIYQEATGGGEVTPTCTKPTVSTDGDVFTITGDDGDTFLYTLKKDDVVVGSEGETYTAPITPEGYGTFSLVAWATRDGAKDSAKTDPATITLTDPNGPIEFVVNKDFPGIGSSYGLAKKEDIAYANFGLYSTSNSSSLQFNNSTSRTCGLYVNAKDGYLVKGLKIDWGTATSKKDFDVYTSSSAYTAVSKSDNKIVTLNNSNSYSYTFTTGLKNISMTPSATGATYPVSITVIFEKEVVIEPVVVAAPTIEFDEATNTVTLSTEQEAGDGDVDILYTINGDDPKANGINYNNTPFKIKENCTVKAVTYWMDENADEYYSEVVEKAVEYTPAVKLDAPVIEFADNTVTISATLPEGIDEEGVFIYYTLDGSDPKANEHLTYKEPFKITADCTVKAVVYYMDLENEEEYYSPVAEKAVTYTAPVSKAKITLEVLGQSEQYPYILRGSGIQVTVTGADKENVIFDVKGLSSGNAVENGATKDNMFFFAINEDTQVDVLAIDEDGVEANFSEIVRLDRPTFRLKRVIDSSVAPWVTEDLVEPYDIEPGELIMIDTHQGQGLFWDYTVTYTDWDGTQKSYRDLPDNCGSVSVWTRLDFTAKGKAWINTVNGEEEYCSEFEFSVKAKPFENTAQFSIDETVIDPAKPLTGENKVTLTIPGAVNIYMYEVNLDGSSQPWTAYNGTDNIQFDVDKMHRRFYYCWNTKYNAVTPWYGTFFKVVEGVETVDQYELVTAADPIKVGDEFIVVAKDAKKAMSKMNSNNCYAIGFADNLEISNVINTQDLPKDGDKETSIVKVIASGNAEYPFALMVGEKYLYNNYTGNKTDNQNLLREVNSLTEQGYCKIELNENNEATITYNFSNNNNGNYKLQYNASSKLFASYPGTQTLPVLYRHVTEKAVPVSYEVNVHHKPYSKQNVRGIAEGHEAFEMVENHKDGVYTYTTKEDFGDLSGFFSFTIEGVEHMGHADQAISNFHPETNAPVATEGEGEGEGDSETEEVCNEEHAPYVYAENGKSFTLVSASHEKAVPLSTNPNHYHGGEILHNAPVVSLQLRPFQAISMAVTSAPETLTAVSNISVDNVNGPVEYYNLQGVRVVNPLPGTVVIERRGTHTAKVLVR